MQRTRLEIGLATVNRALMDIVSHVAPWVAPIAPAYMVYRSVIANFALPPAVALSVAAVVEATGMMSIDTMTRVKYYRVNKRKSDPEVAGHGWLKWAATGYMALVLVVTLLSDIIPHMSRWAILVVLPMVFLLYMVNSVRRQMDMIEAELDNERRQKRTQKRQIVDKPDRVIVQTNGHQNGRVSDSVSDRQQAVSEWLEQGLNTSEMAELANVSARTIRRDINALEGI